MAANAVWYENQQQHYTDCYHYYNTIVIKFKSLSSPTIVCGIEIWPKDIKASPKYPSVSVIFHLEKLRNFLWALNSS